MRRREQRDSVPVINATTEENIMNTQVIPGTQNRTGGFWAAMGQHADKAWTQANIEIAEETGEPFDIVRERLDGRAGHYFAVIVLSKMYWGEPLKAAIRHTAEEWRELAFF
jgi:hypothetical protein